MAGSLESVQPSLGSCSEGDSNPLIILTPWHCAMVKFWISELSPLIVEIMQHIGEVVQLVKR